jgi:hypothetical protein
VGPIQLILQIGADPVSWYLHDADYEALAAQLSQAAGPVTVPVFGPLSGRMVLNTRAAGNVALGPPGLDIHGTHPSDGRVPGTPPLLYVPTVSPPGPSPAGYRLPPDTDLAGLEQQIVAAMTQSSFLSVPLSIQSELAVVVLSGASLSYCVLCPAKPPGPLGS